MDWKNERMGPGYVTGSEREIQISLSARVGGRLSTLRAGAASLLQLLLDLRSRSSTPLLLFVHFLRVMLLDILQRWGKRASFHPHPADVVHFEVLFPSARQTPAVGRPDAASEGEKPSVKSEIR
jgi:hypothetical protein